MSHNQQDDLEYQKASSHYSVSSMSNTKWLKLFTAIDQSGIEIQRAQWEFIDSDHSIWQGFPTKKDLLPKRFADGSFQPFEYKWIEWIYIPSFYHPDEKRIGYKIQQDIEGFVKVLQKIGQFDIEELPDGIRLYAYRT